MRNMNNDYIHTSSAKFVCGGKHRHWRKKAGEAMARKRA